MDDGEKPVEDEATREALRARARGVWMRTFAVAVVGTALVWFLLP